MIDDNITTDSYPAFLSVSTRMQVMEFLFIQAPWIISDAGGLSAVSRCAVSLLV